MYKIYYDVLQPYFGEESLKLHYIDTDCLIVSIKTKNIFKLKNLKDFFWV